MFKKKKKKDEPNLELVTGGAPEPGAVEGDPKKKKKKGGKKVLFIILGLVLLGALGGGGFMVATGRLKLPSAPTAKKTEEKPKEGASTKPAAKAPAAAGTAPAAAAAKPVVRKPPTPAPVKSLKPAVVMDPEKGAKSVARVWEKIPPEKLAEMAKGYSDLELARILGKMDIKKSAGVLSVLEPERAAKVSKEIERLASVVSPETTGT